MTPHERAQDDSAVLWQEIALYGYDVIVAFSAFYNAPLPPAEELEPSCLTSRP